MWTPVFPRVAGWAPPPNQLPVSAINFVCERTNEGVNVAVSVFRGSPHQREDPVKTVLVTARAPVVVDDLRSLGVQPVTLTLANLEIPQLAIPDLAVASPQIEMHATVSAVPTARYTIVLRNHAAKAVRAIAIETTRAGRLSMSARRAGHLGEMFIKAGGVQALEISIPAGAPGPTGAVTLAAPDRIDIVTVIWEDGTYDGDVGPAIDSLTSDYGDRLQLSRVLGAFQRARSAETLATVSDLRSVLADLSIEVTDDMVADARSHVPNATAVSPSHTASILRSSLAAIRKTALDDLTAFDDAPAGAGTLQSWLNTTIDQYLRWFDRLRR
ncbi:MAG TPA: hypothetical protein VLT86_16425 [Vicinamibacterales bacterium]|nr:hypothetical protein [Vicinamibacterales bacterium]